TPYPPHTEVTMNPATDTPTSVIVVGGGVTGLLTARRLCQAGLTTTLLERSPRTGGQIHTTELNNLPIDLGAESIHLAHPGMRELVDELNLTPNLTGSRPGTSWLWTGTRRRPLPEGVGPAGPTKILPVLTSGILNIPALARAGLEPLYAHLTGRIDLTPGHDISVGEFVTNRFGHAVTNAFVDPLLGSLHSGDVNRLSLRATSPALIPAATQGRSLLRRRQPKTTHTTTPLPMFASWPTGLSTLTNTLLRDTNVTVELDANVTTLTRHTTETGTTTYTLTLSDERQLTADAIVIATPAHTAANLIRPTTPTAAAILDNIETAHTATIVMAFPRHDVAHLPALNANGFLIPSAHAPLLKAGTHLDRKWAHLDDGKNTLFRLSVGRAGNNLLATLDDDALIDQVLRDLHTLTGINTKPAMTHIHRWKPGLPQLTVGHTDRITAVRTDLATSLPGVELAGASYDGLGVGACVTSANKAAQRLLKHLDITNTPAHTTQP
ncbi:protoporphyrinogen oxidase, partial [Dermatophilus congolensis]